jgi:hypothetical protein
MKNKKIFLYIIVVLLIALGLKIGINKKSTGTISDHKNTFYIVDNQGIKLNNGISTIESAPGSASKIVTKYFGNEIRKDLNGDGKQDIAFLITQNTGGSGTFFYVVAAIANENGYSGSRAFLIGDRIAPQNTESGPQDSIIVNYADRAPQEPMTAKPSIGKSLRLILDPSTMKFKEVVI